MSEKKELMEKTNPVFNTAKAMLLHFCIAGNEDAPVLAKKFGIDADSFLADEEQKVALGADLTLMTETRYRAVNKAVCAYPDSTVLDLACGYTPRALDAPFRDMHYIGCDLPIVAEDVGPVVGEILAERGIKNTEFHSADVTNYRLIREAADSVRGGETHHLNRRAAHVFK